LADGVILGYGLTVEKVKTSGLFTHFTWVDLKGLAANDRPRAAFIADRERRTQEEDAIANLFNRLRMLRVERSQGH
jgi:hypothetical protein